ncbi:hypothetical protein ACRQTN_14460 [Pectobacterium brasiliense]|uniref:hypothetical protein n=1 Tax=Pectobacterium TaxID=122277 RepID=UPI0004E643DD|nr:hypothetical protein [Pectobacterium brasiliense]KFF68767.1 hypothetical protein IW00_07365 [Pectobacterium brasiliense]
MEFLQSINEFGMKSNNYGSFFAGLLVIIVTGIVVFFIRDVLKKPPSFSGAFYLSLKTKKSKMNPYIGLVSYYMMTLIDEGDSKFSGKIEKIFDIENDGKCREYIGRHRNLGKIHGKVDRYYFRRNKLSVLVEMNGNEVTRESSVVLNFKKVSNKKMVGYFITTAADSSGEAIFQCHEFKFL